MATAAPSVSGGARAAVALPSAFAFASDAAEDQTVKPDDPNVRPDGRSALVVDFAMLTAIAAAAVIDPSEDDAGGVDGAPEAAPLTPFALAVLLPRVRWVESCASGVAPAPLAG